MPTFESKKCEIEQLVDKWQPISKTSTQWSPFRDSWTIDTTVGLAPINALLIERNLAVQNNLMLNEMCHEVLSGFWVGAPVLRQGHNSCPDHFHSYQPARLNMPIWDMWRRNPAAVLTPQLWWCLNIQDAAEKYSWSDGNVGSFASLALALQIALAEDDQNRIAALCFLILRWGGVENRSPGFQSWIVDQAANGWLGNSLIDATRRLIPQSNADTDIFSGGGRDSYFMDSSSTKIYAAVAMNFENGLDLPMQDVLIYDGRVAAAIGLITKYVLQSLGYDELPGGLRFPVERNLKRDPSAEGFIFPKFGLSTPRQRQATHASRAAYARIASRYIQAITGILEPSVDFVIAEKGLFMIGYDVR